MSTTSLLVDIDGMSSFLHELCKRRKMRVGLKLRFVLALKQDDFKINGKKLAAKILKVNNQHRWSISFTANSGKYFIISEKISRVQFSYILRNFTEDDDSGVPF